MAQVVALHGKYFIEYIILYIYNALSYEICFGLTITCAPELQYCNHYYCE